MEPPPVQKAPAPQPTYARDEDYYFEDGSVVLLVEKRLFRIHRALFARQSTFFRDLFMLPQGADSREGQSDEDPIVCQDGLKDFQTLCWAVYASPNEIREQQSWEKMDSTKLITVACISHKYDFAAVRDWALDMLEDHSAAKPTECIAKFGPWSRVQRILTLAKQCKREELARRLEEDWLGRIEAGEVGALRLALDAAESCPLLRNFHGRAYYAYLRSSNFFDLKASKKDAIAALEIGSYVDETMSSLSAERQLRLQRGFFSLSAVRARLLQPPNVEANPACSNHARSCLMVWQSWWKRILSDVETYGGSVCNPGDILTEVQKKAKAGPMRANNPPYCDASMRAQAQKMAEQFFDSLPDRFMIS